MHSLYIYSIFLHCTTLNKIMRNFLGEFLGLRSSLLDHPLHPCHMFCLVVDVFVASFLHVVTSLSRCPFSITLLSLLIFEPSAALDHVLLFADVCWTSLSSKHAKHCTSIA